MIANDIGISMLVIHKSKYNMLPWGFVYILLGGKPVGGGGGLPCTLEYMPRHILMTLGLYYIGPTCTLYKTF